MKRASFLLETRGQAENKRLKRSNPNQGREESRALHPARDLSPQESAARHRQPTEASLTDRGSQSQAAHGRAQAPDAASPAGGLEVPQRAQGGCGPELLPSGPHHGSSAQQDLWLQEVSNLSEWLSPGHWS